MPELDRKPQDLDTVYDVLVDCATENISFWELVPVIRLALKNAYPEAKFKITVEVE